MIDHPHGTPARYAHGTSTEPPCREECCRRPHLDAQNRRRRQRAYGRPSMTPAGPVRGHVASLVAAGLATKQIARRSGVSDKAIRTLLGIETGLAASKTVRTSTAEKLYAVTATEDDLPGTVRVAAFGTRRRLQAMVASGRPVPTLADELGWVAGTVRKVLYGDHRATVLVHQAREVRALVARLWDVPPPAATRVDRYRIAHARRLARVYGWVPIAAWDDDEIDLPRARPHVHASTLATARAAERSQQNEAS